MHSLPLLIGILVGLAILAVAYGSGALRARKKRERLHAFAPISDDTKVFLQLDGMPPAIIPPATERVPVMATTGTAPRNRHERRVAKRQARHAR